jgi:ABC-type transport system involved in multi-copper enzyme maturation permease subunit
MFFLSSIIYCAFFYSLGMFISGMTRWSASSLVISLFVWALLVFVIPNLGNTLARQLTKLPSVHQLEMKRHHIWIKEVFEMIQTMRSGERSQASYDSAVSSINSGNDKLVADYRTRFNGLVTLSKNITRFSPTAAFTFLATDLAGTGVIEEAKLKQAILQYKDSVWNKPVDSGGNILGDFPAFTFERSSIKEILAEEGLMNFTVLLLFNIIAFAAAYVVFLRYDVR